MWGMAGAAYTPGMPQLDAYDAATRQRERAAAKERRAKRPKTHVRTKSQRKSNGTDRRGEPIHGSN